MNQMFELAGALLLTFFGALFIWHNYEYIFAFLIFVLIVVALWAVCIAILFAAAYFLDWDGSIEIFGRNKNVIMTLLAIIIGGYMWMLSLWGILSAVQNLKEEVDLFVVTGLVALFQLSLTILYTILFIGSAMEGYLF